MAILIVREEEPYRLIRDDAGRYAVIEARAGHVYSLHGRHRNAAEDTPEGMAAVVGNGWRAEGTAWQRFRQMCRREKRYSRILW